MSVKAYVQLSEPLSDISGGDGNTVSNTNTRSKLTIFLICAIVVIIILIVLTWYFPPVDQPGQPVNSNGNEPFNPDDISDRDSFPARIDSNTTMSASGTCHRSILKNRGYKRPYHQMPSEAKKERKKKKVRWSDSLVMIAKD